MASQPASSPPPPNYEAAQEHIAAIVTPLVAAAFAKISMDALETSLRAFTLDIASIVHQYGRVAGTVALKWFQHERQSQGVPGAVRSVMPSPLSVREIAAEIDISRVLEAPEQVTTDAGAVAQTVFEQVDQAVAQSVSKSVGAQVDKLVLSQGDAAITQAVEHDREASGWARGLEPGACSFCMMLASRGAVFKKDTIGKSDHRFKGNASTIKVHNHCHCYPIPVWGKYVPGVREKAAMDLWQRVVVDQHLTGEDAQKAFRAEAEGREYIPAKGGKHARELESKSQLDKDIALGAVDRAALIAKLRASEAACKKSGLIASLKSVRERIAQLEQANIESHRKAS